MAEHVVISVIFGSKLLILFTWPHKDCSSFSAQPYYVSSYLPPANDLERVLRAANMCRVVCMKCCVFTYSCHGACWSHWSGASTVSPVCSWTESFPAVGSQASTSDSGPAVNASAVVYVCCNRYSQDHTLKKSWALEPFHTGQALWWLWF